MTYITPTPTCKGRAGLIMTMGKGLGHTVQCILILKQKQIIDSSISPLDCMVFVVCKNLSQSKRHFLVQSISQNIKKK